MKIPQRVDPLKARAAVDALIGESDRRSTALARRLHAWSAGWAAGHQVGYEAGVRDTLEQEARQRREAAGLVAEAAAIQQQRWRLRGERRTRQTFSQPHPDDYPGRGGDTS